MTYRSHHGGLSVGGHLDVLNPPLEGQRHLQVEEVCCQVACGLREVEAHPEEEVKTVIINKLHL